MIRKYIVAPSILNCDYALLKQQCDDVLDKGAHWLHLDVMDGHFVPNLTFGMPIVESLRRHFPDAFLDCHLMVQHPCRWLTQFCSAGASQITVHAESDFEGADLEATVASIKKLGLKAGVAIKPGTPLSVVEHVIAKGQTDLLLCMTVQPGFGGAKFDGTVMEKVKQARTKFPGLRIQVDGGINPETSKTAKEAGADVLVAGTAIFKSSNREQAIRMLASD